MGAGVRDPLLPSRSKSFEFHAAFGENGQINRLVPLSGISIWEILDPLL